MENCLEGDEIGELLADFPLSTKQSSSKKNLFYVQIIYNRVLYRDRSKILS